jgi:hypothetical protein
VALIELRAEQFMHIFLMSSREVASGNGMAREGTKELFDRC